VGAELGKSGGSRKSQAQSSSMVEGHQQFTLHTTRFDITQPILLALLRQVKLNNMGFLCFFFAQMENNPLQSRKGTKDRP